MSDLALEVIGGISGIAIGAILLLVYYCLTDQL